MPPPHSDAWRRAALERVPEEHQHLVNKAIAPWTRPGFGVFVLMMREKGASPPALRLNTLSDCFPICSAKLTYCNVHNGGEGDWLALDEFESSGLQQHKCAVCARGMNARRGQPTAIRQPHLIVRYDLLAAAVEGAGGDLPEGALDDDFTWPQLKALGLKYGERPLIGFCFYTRLHVLTRLRSTGFGWCASHGNGEGEEPGIWFQGNERQRVAGRCGGCDLGADDIEAVCNQIMKDLRHRAKYKRVGKVYKPRDDPKPVDPDLKEKLRAHLADPASRSPAFGMVYDRGRKTFYQISVDSLLGHGDYRAPEQQEDGSWVHYYRFSLKLENVPWVDGENWSEDDGLESIKGFIQAAESELHVRIVLAQSAARQRFHRNPLKRRRAKLAIAFLAEPDVRSVTHSWSALDELERAHAEFETQSAAAATAFEASLNRDDPAFDREFYDTMEADWRAHMKTDKKTLKLDTRSYGDFKKYGLPRLLASRGRCDISRALLSKRRQRRPSFNRIKRKHGHAPFNLEVIWHFLNGSGNSANVEDDIMCRARMLEICLNTSRVQLSRAARAALRLLRKR